MSLEFGRPAMMKDEHNVVDLPSSLDDQFIYPTMSWDHLLPTQSASPFIQIVEYIRCMPRPSQALNAACPPHVLSTHDINMSKCLATFSGSQSPKSGHIDSERMRTFLYLQNSRLVLHRHNLAPSIEFQARREAMDRCVNVARDTAQYLQWSTRQESTEVEFHPAASESAWTQQLLTSIGAFHCTHVWRCTLLLLFKLDFANALVCARVSSIWGGRREVNVACGRYLEFFVSELVSRLHQGQTLETDEELIAYVNGDHRCNLDKLWAWRNGGGGELFASPSNSPRLSSEATAATKDGEIGPPDHEEKWHGWERIIMTIERLQREQKEEQEARTKPPLLTSPRSNDWRTSTASPGGVTSTRLSIKDLI